MYLQYCTEPSVPHWINSCPFQTSRDLLRTYTHPPTEHEEDLVLRRPSADDGLMPHTDLSEQDPRQLALDAVRPELEEGKLPHEGMASPVEGGVDVEQREGATRYNMQA